MDPDVVDQLTAELVRLYATPQPQPQQQPTETEPPPAHQLATRQTSVESAAGRCEDALDDLVRELHAENLQLRRRLRASEVEHCHRVRCLMDTLDRMQTEVAEIASRKSVAVKRPKSDCTDQATASASAAASLSSNCCHGNAGFRRRSISIGEDARELASVLAHACQELRAENACLMRQLRQLRARAPPLRTSWRRREDTRRCQAEQELAQVREELHRLRVGVLEASLRYPGVESLLLRQT